MIDHVGAFFEARGLRYNPHPDLVPNSRAALRLGELARSIGVFEPFHQSLMDAYWDQGRDIGDRDVLRELAEKAGVPPDEADDVLATDRYLDAVENSTREAVTIGVTGVPAFLLERRLLVLGAQPEDVFEQAFARLAETPAEHE